jgi:hypothetical protein
MSITVIAINKIVGFSNKLIPFDISWLGIEFKSPEVNSALVISPVERGDVVRSAEVIGEVVN